MCSNHDGWRDCDHAPSRQTRTIDREELLPVREIAATGGEFVANEIVNRNDQQPQPVASVEDHPVSERVGSMTPSIAVNKSVLCRRISSWIIAWLHEILRAMPSDANPKSSKGFEPKILVDSGLTHRSKDRPCNGASMRGQRARADNELNPV